MPESELRFVRNQQKTAALQRALRAPFADKTSTSPRSFLERDIASHFVMDDRKTGRSLHMLMGIAGPEDGLRLKEEGDFFGVKGVFLELAIDRQSPVIFYFKGQKFKIEPNGHTLPLE